MKGYEKGRASTSRGASRDASKGASRGAPQGIWELSERVLGKSERIRDGMKNSN